MLSFVIVSVVIVPLHHNRTLFNTQKMQFPFSVCLSYYNRLFRPIWPGTHHDQPNSVFQFLELIVCAHILDNFVFENDGLYGNKQFTSEKTLGDILPFPQGSSCCYSVFFFFSCVCVDVVPVFLKLTVIFLPLNPLCYNLRHTPPCLARKKSFILQFSLIFLCY